MELNALKELSSPPTRLSHLTETTGPNSARFAFFEFDRNVLQAEAFCDLERAIGALESDMPFVILLRNAPLKDRHWRYLVRVSVETDDVEEQKGDNEEAYNNDSAPTLTIGAVFRLGLSNIARHVHTILERARVESELDGLLESLRNIYLSRSLRLDRSADKDIREGSPLIYIIDPTGYKRLLKSINSDINSLEDLAGGIDAPVQKDSPHYREYL